MSPVILAQKPKQGTHIENWIKYETGLMDATQSLNSMAPTTVMTVEKPQKDDYNKHLTVKPVDVITHLIKLFSKEGQTLLDPFLGSGTTAISCKQSNRSCIGIEINDEYMAIAKQRIGGAI